MYRFDSLDSLSLVSYGNTKIMMKKIVVGQKL